MHGLYAHLCAEGIDTWLDKEKLLPGQDWEKEIRKAVRECDVVVVCISKQFHQKGFRQKEVKIALEEADLQPEGTIFIIPARLEDCDVPESLWRWHWVDLFDKSGYEWLMRSLKRRAAELGRTISRPGKSEDPRPPISTQNWGGIEFVKIPSGEFIMGDIPPLAGDDETPRHPVEIPYDYWIGRFPVTNAQFAKFVEQTYYSHERIDDWKKKPHHPVVSVSWIDTQTFCKWLNNTHGENLPRGLFFRLPTEAEWEKAARGTDGREWPWGNEFDKNNCNSEEGERGRTTPVGTYSPQGDSPYGAADMAGNVWEWTNSLCKPYPYNPADGREDPRDFEDHVVRGGSFHGGKQYARAAYRNSKDPMNRSGNQGFRVVVAPHLSSL